MARLVAIYKKPADVEEFEKHYFFRLRRRCPVSGNTSRRSSVALPVGSPKVYLVGTVHFGGPKTTANAFARSEGRA